jgi:hypothetical protein
VWYQLNQERQLVARREQVKWKVMKEGQVKGVVLMEAGEEVLGVPQQFQVQE